MKKEIFKMAVKFKTYLQFLNAFFRRTKLQKLQDGILNQMFDAKGMPVPSYEKNGRKYFALDNLSDAMKAWINDPDFGPNFEWTNVLKNPNLPHDSTTNPYIQVWSIVDPVKFEDGDLSREEIEKLYRNTMGGMRYLQDNIRALWEKKGNLPGKFKQFIDSDATWAIPFEAFKPDIETENLIQDIKNILKDHATYGDIINYAENKIFNKKDDYNFSNLVTDLEKKDYNPDCVGALRTLLSGLKDSRVYFSSAGEAFDVPGLVFFETGGKFDKLPDKLDVSTAPIDSDKVDMFAEPEVYQTLFTLIYDNKDLREVFANGEGGSKITKMFDRADKAIDTSKILTKHTDSRNSLRQAQKDIKDEVVEGRLAKPFDRHLRHKYRYPQAKGLADIIRELKINPEDGLGKLVKEKDKIQKLVDGKEAGTGDMWGELIPILEQAEVDMPNAFANALKEGAQMKILVSRIISDLCDKGKFTECFHILEFMTTMQYGNFNSDRWPVWKKNKVDWGENVKDKGWAKGLPGKALIWWLNVSTKVVANTAFWAGQILIHQGYNRYSQKTFGPHLRNIYTMDDKTRLKNMGPAGTKFFRYRQMNTRPGPGGRMYQQPDALESHYLAKAEAGLMTMDENTRINDEQLRANKKEADAKKVYDLAKKKANKKKKDAENIKKKMGLIEKKINGKGRQREIAKYQKIIDECQTLDNLMNENAMLESRRNTLNNDPISNAKAISKLDARINNLIPKIKSAKIYINNLSPKYNEAVDMLRVINEENTALQTEYEKLNRQYERLNTEHNALSNEVDAVEAIYAEAKKSKEFLYERQKDAEKRKEAAQNASDEAAVIDESKNIEAHEKKRKIEAARKNLIGKENRYDSNKEKLKEVWITELFAWWDYLQTGNANDWRIFSSHTKEQEKWAEGYDFELHPENTNNVKYFPAWEQNWRNQNVS